jgi:ketosteroid isomerase-like protein
MDPASVQQQVELYFLQIITIFTAKQAETVDAIYDNDAIMTSPYMNLTGKSEILRGYQALSANNVELFIKFDSVTFDKQSLKVMAEIQQSLRPKALGGLMTIK